jgi:serine/threonine protein phosphatase PrpC
LRNGKFTVESTVGNRNHQEDRCFHIQLGKGKNAPHFFGVFDGHGGKEASEECSRLVCAFAELNYGRTPDFMLRNIVQNLLHLTEKYITQGCTMSIALVRPRQNDVWLAVIGDSPIVVVDKEGKVFLSPLHNVGENRKERLLAESRGGKYSDIQGTGYITRGFSGRYIQLSRSLGDHDMGDVLLREPEIFQVKNPRYVIVASDGILEERLDYDDPYRFSERLSSKTEAMDLMFGLDPRDNLTVALWNHG